VCPCLYGQLYSYSLQSPIMRRLARQENDFVTQQVMYLAFVGVIKAGGVSGQDGRGRNELTCSTRSTLVVRSRDPRSIGGPSENSGLLRLNSSVDGRACRLRQLRGVGGLGGGQDAGSCRLKQRTAELAYACHSQRANSPCASCPHTSSDPSQSCAATKRRSAVRLDRAVPVRPAGLLRPTALQACPMLVRA